MAMNYDILIYADFSLTGDLLGSSCSKACENEQRKMLD
jgi:hypothetical protein